MATNCSLYREKIPSAIKEFAEEKGIEWSCTSEKDFQDIFKLTYDKANRFITINYKKNGLTSISCIAMDFKIVFLLQWLIMILY